ncbi:3'-5' exonuclease [Nocardioides sp. URHA0032]|uniref:3'-5' exonuclease n=1 Tax=Nocardioides sp. URHA0032 TaxID=1380388 RepID=UPI000684D572|nr:3'-5' exonuclease [Nocardioides sp. URHA0032]
MFRYGGATVRDGVEHFGPYAVIDFETTGLSPRRDRVVEVAIARVDANGRIEDEFATLVNPVRDVGPTFIHGITNAQVKNAPVFAEVAPELLARMSGAVVVAHNATFEEAFLAAELKRAGIDVVPVPALCTLWLGRQTFATPNYKLGTLARAGGVPLVDKHAALGDVRAVSRLLPQMTDRLSSPMRYSVKTPTWPPTNPARPLPVVTRAVALRKGTDGWMHTLVSRLPGTGLAPDDAAAEAYLDALAEVLSDGRLTGEEADALAHLAGSAGMGGAQVIGLNERFLDGLKAAALEDDLLTAAEIRQLRTAAKALSLPDYYGDLQPTAPTPAPQPAHASVTAEGGAGTDNSMEARGERASRALTMQRSGSSRAEIASSLGVGVETVKALLRDAKFSENPESDPSRLSLARDARQARDSGVTRDVFQSDLRLTSGKATEAWRDAAMLAGRL